MTHKEFKYDLSQKYDICQSCAMPLLNENIKGTNKDNSKNNEYCKYCFENGEFTDDCNIEEMKNRCIEHLVEKGIDRNESDIMLTKKLPQLKRWKNL